MAWSHLALQVGSTYSTSYNTSNQKFGAQTNAASVQANLPIFMSVSGMYTVASGAQTICYGCWFNTSSTSVTLGTTCMTATRIA